MHHPQMLHARTRLTLASGVSLVALLALAALAQPALADEPAPTPLPDALSGPDANSLFSTTNSYGLSCQSFSVPPIGDQWACGREVAPSIYYLAQFAVKDPLVMELYVSGPLPWPPDHDQFLQQMTAWFCDAGTQDQILAFIVQARETTPEPLLYEDASCSLFSDYTTDPIPDQHVIAWAKKTSDVTVVPTATPIPEFTLPPSGLPTAPPPLATPTTSPSPAAATPVPEPTLPGGGADGGSVIRPGDFVRSVSPPTVVTSEPLIVAQSLALAALLVLLMPFPAQLFNSTLETHYKTVRRWFRLDALQAAAGRFGGFWDSLIGILVFVLLGAAIYALLDPSVGVDLNGAASLAGLAIGLVVITIMASAPSLVDALRNHTAWRPRALPISLAVGMICVLISRLTDFLPGYLYGVILGFVFARELTRAEQGRANGLAAVALLATALVSWLGLAVIGPDPTGLLATIAATAFALMLVAGLEAVVFGLLPLRFLPGEPLHATNRLLWAALLFVGAFGFFHILINPASGYLSSTAQTPLFTSVALFVAFGLLSIAFWAYFRNKPVEA